jgi:YbbR domain-containing protein
MDAAIRSTVGYRVLAVLMAIALWFFITYRGQTETTIEAVLEFKNMPAGLEMLKQNIRKVSVSIQGHEQILSHLKQEDLKVVVDLSNGKRGESSYYFDANDVRSSKNFKVLRLDPTFVRVTLDESKTIRITIQPVIVGTPRQGFAVKGITATPAALEVEGARSEVDRVGLLRTEPLDITGLDSDLTQSVRVDTNGRNIRLKSAEVSVKVTIGRK